MFMIPPPFPDPSRWNDIHNEQEKTGIVKWTVIKDKQILSMMENAKQHINDIKNLNNVNIDNNVSINNNDNNVDASNDDNDDEYEEVFEINPDWVSKLAPTIQKLKNRSRQYKAKCKSNRKLIKKV